MEKTKDEFELLLDIYSLIKTYQNHRDLLKMEVRHQNMNLLLDIQHEVDVISTENQKIRNKE
jgi:hypothetical protein